MIPSLPASTTRSWPSSAGALEPRSVSLVLSCSWSVGVNDWRRLEAGERELQHAVAEVGGPVPGAVAGVDEDALSTRLHHGPPRDRIAESLAEQLLGTSSAWRFAQSVLNTLARRPLARSIRTT